MKNTTNAAPRVSTTANEIFWDGSEVSQLVMRHLTKRFGHEFRVWRPEESDSIDVEWELGPDESSVHDFVYSHFPQKYFSSRKATIRIDAPVLLDGRLLSAHRFSVVRTNFFNVGISDIPRLIKAGADINEKIYRGRSAFDLAVNHDDEMRAIALLEAGADFSLGLTEKQLSSVKWSMPALWAAIESRIIAANTCTHPQGPATNHRL